MGDSSKSKNGAKMIFIHVKFNNSSFLFLIWAKKLLFSVDEAPFFIHSMTITSI